MAELKAFDVIIDEDYKTKCYMKADADKAIAAKDKEIAGLKDNERRLKRALYKSLEIMMRNKAAALVAFHLPARAAKFEKAIEKCRTKVQEANK